MTETKSVLGSIILGSILGILFLGMLIVPKDGILAAPENKTVFSCGETVMLLDEKNPRAHCDERFALIEKHDDKLLVICTCTQEPGRINYDAGVP